MIFNETWEDDKGYFWDKHSTRLDEMDENATDPRIEILPTFTDSNGVVWQLPHEDKMGWARLCFDALMDNRIMTVTTKHPSKYKVGSGGQLEACEWDRQTITIHTLNGGWCVIGHHISFYPASETHRVFVMAIGLAYDFGGVVLC